MKTNQNKRLLITSSLICTLFTVSLVGALNVYSSFVSSTNKIEDQQKIINDLKTNNSQQTELISTLNAQIENLTHQISSLESNNSAQARQSHSDASTIAGLQSQLVSANSQIAQLNAKADNLQQQVNALLQGDPRELQTLVFHVCEKGEGYTWGHLPDANSTYDQILDLFPDYQVLLLPELQGHANWTEELTWITNNFGGKQGIPLMLDVFGGGDINTPTPMLSTSDISAAMGVSNVQYLRFAEVISWHQEHPEQPFPLDYVQGILEFCRANNLKLFWTEWKLESFKILQTYIEGYEDIVTVSFSTNSGDAEPSQGFLQISQTFEHWGASVQAWYWDTRGSNLMDMPPSLLAEHALFAKHLAAQIIEFEPYWYFFNNGQPNDNLKLLETVLF
jgi:hypothetical protein